MVTVGESGLSAMLESVATHVTVAVLLTAPTVAVIVTVPTARQLIGCGSPAVPTAATVGLLDVQVANPGPVMSTVEPSE